MYDPSVGRWLEEDPIGFNGGDPNLYRVVGNDPTIAFDPSGEVAVKENEEIKGNQYGNWEIKQHNVSDVIEIPYKSEVDIQFKPNKKTVNSDEISFIQIAKLTYYKLPETRDGTLVRGERLPKKADCRRSKNGWFLDSQPKKYGWFAYGNDNEPEKNTISSEVIPGSCPKNYKVAKLTDWPGDPEGNSFIKWEFQTFAVAKSGKDKGKIYGGISWGFVVGNNRKMISLPRKFLPAPSPDFITSVKFWDIQANGNPKNKTTPDQQPFGSSIVFPKPKK